MEDRAALVEESTRLMAGGFSFMERGDWAAAAECFRYAALLRESLPWHSDEEAAWLLAAAWLNHGDMLLRTAEKPWMEEARTSFDKAIDAMGRIDLERNPAYPERLILAWLNRASVSCELGEFHESLEEFSVAGSLLERWGADSSEVRRFQAAMLRVNRARTLLAAGRAFEAWEETKEGIVRLGPFESQMSGAAAGIQARSIQCRVLAMLLDEPGGPERVGDWIAEATDSAEQALALVRATGFRDHWVADLVRYGALIYRRCQPHFLGAFLVEWLGKGGPLQEDNVLREEMKGALWLAVADTELRVMEMPHETEFVEKQTRVLKALQAGLGRLG